jgi:hypothetical protein
MSFHSLVSRLLRTQTVLLLAVAGIALIGTLLLVSSRAATPFVTAESESGTVTSGASKITDNTASAGAAVKFGTATNSVNPLSSLPLIPWEGGSAYYDNFPKTKAAGWTNPAFIPISAWYMRANSQTDINGYKALGINTSVKMESNANLPLLRSNGMFAVADAGSSGTGTETIGMHLEDEVDMWAGPGNDQWNEGQPWPTVCTPAVDKGGKCGYTALAKILTRVPSSGGYAVHANFGKGIFPGWESDAQFAQFINGYTTIVSDDIYWYTDGDACTAAQGPTMIQGSGPVSIYTGLKDLTQAECRRAANYGVVVDRVRKLDALDGKRQMIWSFVETGSPFQNSRAITGPQVEGAVMSSLIHEARGITYFKHNFSGTCPSNDGLLDCANAPKASVTKINGYIKELAPVLNTQSYQYSFGSAIDAMLKWHNGSAYIFAMGDKGSTGTKTFSLPAGLKTAQVSALHENRTVPVSIGTFNDSFEAEYSYHIYKVTP